jgi:hypothetical protein
VFRTYIVNNSLVGGRGRWAARTTPVDCVVANNLIQDTSNTPIADMGQGTKIEGRRAPPPGR